MVLIRIEQDSLPLDRYVHWIHLVSYSTCVMYFVAVWSTWRNAHISVCKWTFLQGLEHCLVHVHNVFQFHTPTWWVDNMVFSVACPSIPCLSITLRHGCSQWCSASWTMLRVCHLNLKKKKHPISPKKFWKLPSLQLILKFLCVRVLAYLHLLMISA